jgi:hypothetical protein
MMTSSVLEPDPFLTKNVDGTDLSVEKKNPRK